MERKKKTHKKSTAPKIIDLDVQQRKLAIIKQKQCDTIALHIVNTLIEGSVQEDVFLQSLKYLNQCHFQDIVEERAISKICGYPICGNDIRDIPSKKFHISTKSNKVYDITERKNYCSNLCYKAGVFIKDQMLTSPLWFRDQEQIPQFHLLPKNECGIPGKEVDQGIIKLDLEEDQKDQNFTSITKFTQDMVNEIPENIYDGVTTKKNCTDQKNSDSEPANIQVNKSVELEEESKPEVNEYFSNIYGPSLADILKENAEYFDYKSNDKNVIIKNGNKENLELNDKFKETISDNNVKQELEIESNTQEIIEDKQSSSKSETCKIGFDRTVINMKSKSILKNSKNRNLEKKRVSFSEENSIQEIQKIEDENRAETKQEFKKPGESKIDDKTRKKYKNTNLIGVVQERSSYPRNTVNNSDEKALDEIIHNKKDQLVQDNTMSSSNDNNQAKLDSSKEIRLNRMKNSSVFKKSLPLKNNRLKKLDSDLKTKLDKCISQWFTFDSILFLYGEKQVKNIVSDKSFKQFLNKKKNLELDEVKQQQYREVCRRLSLMELADQKFDESVTGKKRRPLPRYEDLRKEGENMDLRVQAFYSGSYEMYEEEVETDTESVKDETEEDKSVVQGPPAVLPLIDNKDLMATRRKIFLSSISRTMSDICEIIQESPNKLLSEMKHLINTFEFTASNIVFKSIEWQFITIFLIQILSIRDPDLRKSFESSEVKVFLSSLTKQFGLSNEYLTELLNKVDIRNLLNECLKKDCYVEIQENVL